MQVLVLAFKVKLIYKVVNRLKKKAVDKVEIPPLLKKHRTGRLEE